MGSRALHNDRGVALLIVLLVTALLVALVFEFAYGTRVSLRAAVNFRDSQRAYFLARSGLKVFLKYQQLKENTPQGEWTVVPIVSAGDTELRMRWEDEAGKIKIGPEAVDPTKQEWFRQLLTETGVSQEIADRMFGSPPLRISLLSELHQLISDEEYGKIERYVTVYSTGAININTASETVLKSVLKNKSPSPEEILMLRRDKPIGTPLPTDINNTNFATTSTISKVQFYATVGGYTKQVEAVVNAGIVQYWRAL